MKYIDLHVHSNVSDGTLTPSGVVKLAVKNQLAAIALTDHDTLAGIKEAQAAALSETGSGNPIRVIPGTELSVFYRKRDIHILGQCYPVSGPGKCPCKAGRKKRKNDCKFKNCRYRYNR